MVDDKNILRCFIEIFRNLFTQGDISFWLYLIFKPTLQHLRKNDEI